MFSVRIDSPHWRADLMTPEQLIVGCGKNIGCRDVELLRWVLLSQHGKRAGPDIENIHLVLIEMINA